MPTTDGAVRFTAPFGESRWFDVWCFWSAKGGVGCTVVTVGSALGAAAAQPTLLVDLGGDVPAVLGIDAPDSGLRDWLAAPAPPPDALSRLEVSAAPGLSLLPWGAESLDIETDSAAPLERWADPAETLARVIALDHRLVLVDVGGRRSGAPERVLLADRLLALATRSTLVTRPCFLAMRSADGHPPPDDVIVVGRQARALRADDVQRAIGAPVVAQLRWDPAIARAVDTGLLAGRLPRSLRTLDELCPEPQTWNAAA